MDWGYIQEGSRPDENRFGCGREQIGIGLRPDEHRIETGLDLVEDGLRAASSPMESGLSRCFTIITAAARDTQAMQVG